MENIGEYIKMEGGRYCKAYFLRDFRRFPDWTENTDNVKTWIEEIDGKEIEMREELEEETILYLHQNYLVTHSPWGDEFIIFDRVTDEWITFCRGELNFQIPQNI